ncbi:unnamed protein product [Prorocentrum cordatum]|uniref:Carboxylesterase type B domain-containing protein n=1 Tax=Prorocentrum cordatum TaxID=2364126 RepID=A0ABN9UAF6_9DINO|nr:unnamed protein product [Polarella glacialis]
MMVWIHGGGFVDGDAGDASEGNTYDGCGLAASHGVIVAGMNYRLGVLGFAALERAGGGVDANFGLEDQREALRWLRDQAFAIGGDPARVTIFGESAGGMSVFHHLVSPRSAGLFRAAISESGLPTAAGREFSLGNTRAFARAAGCERGEPIRACLLGKSMDELIRAQAAGGSPFASNSTGWGATVDGVDLTDYPRRLMAHRLRVPVLAGFNTDEGNVFVWHVLTEFDPGTALNPAQLAEVFRRYPAAPEGDQRILAARVFTDYGILCGTQCALSSAAPGKAFFYRFDHRGGCPKPGTVPGVYHGLELPYVFGTPASYQCSFDAGEEALSARMQRLWADFAKHLAPSPSDGSFPAFGGENMTNLVLRASGDSLEGGYRADFCRFWSEVWQLGGASPLLV